MVTKVFRKERFPLLENTCETLANMTEIVRIFVEKNPILQSPFERLEHLYGDRVFIEMIMTTSHSSIGLTDVLCHGDMWTYNMLWETVGTEKTVAGSSLGALIDWQHVHTGMPSSFLKVALIIYYYKNFLGSIGEDFGHLLTFCCDASTRRQTEQQLLPKYWLDLKEQLTSLKIPWNVTKSQFLRAYRRCFIVHAMHLPFIAYVMLNINSIDNEEEQARRNEVIVPKA
uniref:CHK domain-containing protein n=1 Tax=Heterorhabditis bacteriophora TaxID=37862 RepID=A0A1I7XNJ3_HETBA